MSKNMSAIGFKSVEKKKKLVSGIIKKITQKPDSCFSHTNKDGNILLEQYGYAGENFGLIVYGTSQDGDRVKIHKWNTFASSKHNTNICGIQFERLHNGDVCAFCEDEGTGYEFEFRLNNVSEYTEFLRLNPGKQNNVSAKANIVGLCSIGNVLFPILKNEEYARNRQAEIDIRRELAHQLRSGDKSAEQQLMSHTANMAENVRERLKTEDVLSVFEGYILPYGEFETTFALLGNILSIEQCVNEVTSELIYCLDLDVSGVCISVLINEHDIVGLPMDGMRFMGICNLQGTIDFKEACM